MKYFVILIMLGWGAGSPLAANEKMDVQIELVPFSPEEFASFYEDFAVEYADTMCKAHMFEDRQEANRAAKTQMLILFPDGLATKGQRLFKIEKSREDVGILWYTEKKSTRQDENTAWLCYVYVKPPFRRMGYAKAAITQMEMHLKSLGILRVGMSVFSTTSFSKNLYESLGYVVVNTFLTPDSKEVVRYELSKNLAMSGLNMIP